jgi:hypothetical protein
MSMREKLAWARKNGVTPPSYVLESVAREEAEHHQVAGCCQAKEELACCSSRAVAPAGSSCCSKYALADDRNNPSLLHVEWVLGVHAQKCQGLTLMWVLVGAALPPVPRMEVYLVSHPPTWWISPLVCHWQSISSLPDVPPPRIG